VGPRRGANILTILISLRKKGGDYFLGTKERGRTDMNAFQGCRTKGRSSQQGNYWALARSRTKRAHLKGYGSACKFRGKRERQYPSGFRPNGKEGLEKKCDSRLANYGLTRRFLWARGGGKSFRISSSVRETVEEA